MTRTLVAGDRLDAVNVEWLSSPPVPQLERPVRRVPSGEVAGHDALRELLDAIPNTGGLELGYDEWFRVVAAIHHETQGSDVGLQLAHDFSMRATGKYDAGFLDERVWPFIRSEGRDAVVGIGSLRRLAGGFGWHEALDADAFEDVSLSDDRPPGGAIHVEPNGDQWRVQLVTSPAIDATLAQGMQLVARATASVVPAKRRGIPEAHHLTTDQANANRLVNAFGRQVLVSAGRWHVWDGRRWLADESDVYRYGCQLSTLIRDEASAIRARASVLPDLAAQQKAAAVSEALLKWAAKSEMKGTIEAAIGLARKMLTVDATALDADPWALNCLNGVVDLRTGAIRPHDPDELITKLVPVAYVADALCPTWDRVLRQITREDVGVNGHGCPLADYLARWWGYCLTGIVTEQVFVVLWGGGANGKSTVLRAMTDTLGDYAAGAPPGLMAASKGERHPTEIASLMGRRMVTSHESGEGIVLREDFIKQATGDDVLTARFMREDFFSFSPTHKLQLLTNHKPQIKGQDRGIWRRVQLVPFVASFGEAGQVLAGTHTHERDLGIVERLQGELEGILAWRVRGAVAWAAGGLQPPAAVLVASAAYKAEQDRVGQFVEECCERDVAAMEALTDGMGGLYPAYVAWCKESGVYALSKARFTDDVLRVTGVAGTVERRSSVENGKRRRMTMIPGIRLLSEG